MSTAAATTTPTPTATTTPGQTVVQTTTTPAATTTPAPSEWYSSFPDDLKSKVQQKNFKDPAAMAESYFNVEKLIGHPAERLLKLPENMSDKEAMKAIFGKLGRPEKSDDYKVPMPEKGGDENFAKAAKSMFHEAGLTVSQGEELTNRWNGWINETQKANEAAKVAKVEADDKALRKEWGAAFEQNIKTGAQAAKTFGLTEEQINSLQEHLGLPSTMKFFYHIGSKLGEADFVTASSTGSGKGILSPGAANARIQQLGKDKEFMNKYANGDRAAIEEMTNLHQWANPEQTA